MTTRRSFFAALVGAPFALAALATAKSQDAAWAVRLKVGGQSAKSWGVLDARTGKSVGRQFDLRLAGRLYRAMKSGAAIKVPVWVLDEQGHYIPVGGRVLSELRLVRVLPA